MNHPNTHPFRLDWHPTHPLAQALARALQLPVEKLLGLDELGSIWRRVQGSTHPAEFLDRCLRILKLRWNAEGPGVLKVPAQGPLVVVANHPYGGAEGLVIARWLLSMREDVRVLANPILSRIPELSGIFIAVDPYEKRDARNLGALRAAREWLSRGGCLVVFPSGTVSHFRADLGSVADPEWKTSAVRLARHAGAPVLPVYVPGGNGPLFNLAGLIHPVLRTVLLPREMVVKRRNISLRIGVPVPVERLGQHQDDRAATRYLRERVYLLIGHARAARLGPLFPSARLIAAIPAEDLAREVEALPRDSLMAEQGPLEVRLARSPQIPRLLREIGRLREETFRAAGEGTGRALDLDRFDLQYHHLFLWNRETREVVGAYRLCFTDELIRRHGIRGLYTSTLFRYHRKFFAGMPPAMELGRSFVRTSYQREFAPLLLLWKGLGAVVVRHPRVRLVFGPVSMDRGYDLRSRELIVAFLEKHRADAKRAAWVRPRRPFRIRRGGALDIREAAGLLSGMEELGEIVSSREADGRSVPVLMRQYLKLGGRMAGFNRDPSFGDVIDGLVLVDLHETEPRVLSRYLGKEGAEKWLNFNGKRDETVDVAAKPRAVAHL
jgi:putative hemolysin